MHHFSLGERQFSSKSACRASGRCPARCPVRRVLFPDSAVHATCRIDPWNRRDYVVVRVRDLTRGQQTPVLRRDGVDGDFRVY